MLLFRHEVFEAGQALACLHPLSESKPDTAILGAEEYEPDDAQDQDR